MTVTLMDLHAPSTPTRVFETYSRVFDIHLHTHAGTLATYAHVHTFDAHAHTLSIPTQDTSTSPPPPSPQAQDGRVFCYSLASAPSPSSSHSSSLVPSRLKHDPEGTFRYVIVTSDYLVFADGFWHHSRGSRAHLQAHDTHARAFDNPLFFALELARHLTHTSPPFGSTMSMI